jgi:hypothetical protein
MAGRTWKVWYRVLGGISTDTSDMIALPSVANVSKKTNNRQLAVIIHGIA